MDKTARTAQTEQRILDAALRCYQDHGIGSTSLDQVSREAAVGRTTLYRYVANREDLLNKVLLRDAKERNQELEVALRYHRDLGTALVDGLLFIMRGRRSRPMFKLLFEDDTLRGRAQLTPATFRPMATALLQRRFAEDQARGKIRDSVTLELAAELVARLGLSLMASPEHFLDDEVALRRFLETMLVPAIIK